MDTLLVAFGHKARRGKDTAVAAILAKHKDNYDIRRYGLGDALKREVNETAEKAGGMFALFTRLAQQGVLPSWVKYDPDADMTDPVSPLGKQRTLLQWWGTELRRAQDSFYWVKKLRDTLRREKPQIALVADLRFFNEMQWVKSESGLTVRLEREGFVDISTSGHQSECELDAHGKLYDYTITASDGDVDEVRRCALWAFDHIIERLKTPDVTGFVDLGAVTTVEGADEKVPA